MRAAWLRTFGFPCRDEAKLVSTTIKSVSKLFLPSATTGECSWRPQTSACYADTSPGSGWKSPPQSRWGSASECPRSPSRVASARRIGLPWLVVVVVRSGRLFRWTGFADRGELSTCSLNCRLAGTNLDLRRDTIFKCWPAYVLRGWTDWKDTGGWVEVVWIVWIQFWTIDCLLRTNRVPGANGRRQDEDGGIDCNRSLTRPNTQVPLAAPLLCPVDCDVIRL